MAVFLLSACTTAGPAADSSAHASPSAPDRCTSVVKYDPLPDWARGGFSPNAPPMAHVLSDRGEIMAILFAEPLTTPPRPDRNNKILWKTLTPVTQGGFKIEAQRVGTGETTSIEDVDPPGPSIIDLPQPGCWRLSLTWPGKTDTIDLVYVQGNAS